MGGKLVCYTFNIYKTSNEIEDICISYGLCKLLEDNKISYELKDNKSMYIICTKEFNLDDLEYFEVDEDEIWNLNSGLNKTEKLRNITNLNNFMKENLNVIMKYYLGKHVETVFKNEDAIGIGNGFYSLGIRGSSSHKCLKVKSINKYLSMYGWFFGCSYCKTDDVELTTLLKPINTSELRIPFNFSYIDKETGEIKRLIKLRAVSGVNLAARLYIETLMEQRMLIKNYESIIYIQNIPAGNKPLNDRTYCLKIYDLSYEYLDELLKKLTWSTVPKDSKEATARYIVSITRYNSFSDLIKVYSKDNQVLNYDFMKEILGMYSETIYKIYNNEVISKLGFGFNRLLRDDKGFAIQVMLYNVANEKHFFKAVRYILDLYSRNYNKSSLINEDELKELTKLITNKEESKICADAVLALGKVFIKVKKKNEEASI